MRRTLSITTRAQQRLMRTGGAAMLVVSAALCLAFSAGASAQNAPGPQGSPPGQAQARQTTAPSSNTNSTTQNVNTRQIPWGPGNALMPSTSGGSYAMLTQLQQENILLDQQLKIAEKTKQLQALEKQSSSSDSSSSSGGPSLADLAALGGEPRVLLVEGRPGNVRAMISLPSGGTILTKAGDMIPQVGRVVSISANTVLVRSAKHKLTAIPFWSSFDSSSASTSESNGGFNAMPPPIPNRIGASGPARPGYAQGGSGTPLINRP